MDAATVAMSLLLEAGMTHKNRTLVCFLLSLNHTYVRAIRNFFQIPVFWLIFATLYLMMFEAVIYITQGDTVNQGYQMVYM